MKFHIQNVQFEEDGTVLDFQDIHRTHIAQRRLEAATQELQCILEMNDVEREMTLILMGKSIENLQDNIVKYALWAIDTACKITAYNMLPSDKKPSIRRITAE